MKYVLDSCVAVKWFLAETDSAKAIQLRDEFNQQIHELVTKSPAIGKDTRRRCSCLRLCAH
jgi:hypothetical protein